MVSPFLIAIDVHQLFLITIPLTFGWIHFDLVLILLIFITHFFESKYLPLN